MAVPVLNLNLAPQPGLWRQQHVPLGWTALACGSLCLAGALGFTWRAYHQAGRAGLEAVSLAKETQRVARQEKELQADLQTIDATREQARWKLAERILQERSLPWSRLTAELERCMVPDMRLRSVQRVRGSGQQLALKLKGEARTVAAENAFIGALGKAPVFEQVVLEREGERQGGGWEFELTLPVVAVPPPYVDAPIKAAATSAAPQEAPTPAAAQPPAKVPAARPTPPAPPRPAPPLQATAPEGVVERPAAAPRRAPGRTRRIRHDEGDTE